MRPHEPAYDGLRALAILLVVGFHCNLPLMGGGALGVDVFFVLSGFLISRLLVDELEASGHIRFGGFMLRRWSRLGPAALVTLVAVGVLSLLVTVDPAHSLEPKDVLGAATYSTNWLVAFGAHPASLLTHFWSLAMEEQFYVIWPLLLLLLWRVGGRTAVISGMVGVVVCGCAWRALLDHSGATAIRITFGGDTHGPDALALGGLLAMWPRKLDPRLGALGLTALAILVAYPGRVLPIGAWYSLAEIAAVLVVGCAPTLRPLALRPAVMLGRISYAVYLWHLPVLFILIRPRHWPSGMEFATTLGAAVILAAASYRFVEAPARRRLLTRLVASQSSVLTAQPHSQLVSRPL